MRLIVLDASPIGGGPVSRALECATSEAARGPGDVLQVRLYDLFSVCCATCRACGGTGRCTRRSPELQRLVVTFAEADALLVGTAGHLHARDPRCEALLRRLAGGFCRVETCRGLEGHNTRAGARKVAALVSSAPRFFGIPAVMGLLPAGLGAVWRQLDRSGVHVVGCAAVATRWSGPDTWDATRDRARRLGRALAVSRGQLQAPPAPRIEAPAPGPAPVFASHAVARSA